MGYTILHVMEVIYGMEGGITYGRKSSVCFGGSKR
jgi:hypothetical protein